MATKKGKKAAKKGSKKKSVKRKAKRPQRAGASVVRVPQEN